MRLSDYEQEQREAAQTVMEAIAGLPGDLGQFARGELADGGMASLAGVVLAAALPLEDDPVTRDGRIALAAALDILQLALHIHRLLLLAPIQADTVDKSLLGGTILVGDYFFSRAAILAARTQNPEVVSTFAELLKTLSEDNLRRVFLGDGDPQAATNTSEQQVLRRFGARAGALMAALPQEVQDRLVLLGESLTPTLMAEAPPHQQERWRALLQRGAAPLLG